MTTLPARPPYTDAELKAFYPPTLELQQVQILLRHGERTPISSRFKNTGLATYWPYCEAANRFKDVVLTGDRRWDTLHWKRRLETFDANNGPIPARSSKGGIDNICEPGELTDLGRQTTLALGQRIRRLYVDQLHFLPPHLTPQTQSAVYLRSTPIQRALESTQQAFTGLYPPSARSADLPPQPIVKRAMWEETLFPNEGGCPRFAELARAFADRTAQLYNDSPEMRMLNQRIGKYMPKDSPVVKLDSHPRLSGIMDSISATRAHGEGNDTRLPSEFYEKEVIAGVDRICTEEWFGGYQESNEYRKLGIGGLVGDLTQRMVERVQQGGRKADQKDETFALSLSGCHDTTIAATLTALGGFDVRKDHWPNFTSNVAFELFRRKSDANQPALAPASAPSTKPSWWSSLFPFLPSTASSSASSARTPLADLSPTDRSKLNDYYVRLRYNDTPVSLPYCAQPGKHLESDETFCTLAAFKEAADSFTPRNWRQECRVGLGEPAMRGVVERPPGVVERL
ncbi:hypothetical protein B0A55_07342 [Friedmanniomyces simplex]|uniref:3-phytase n=1 Tax=Friedmanniomyces simplex TaxID=329884 RepID=A0A4V6WL12_9PEZI|nr:hypothetical protein B0A55_07342 [Friedmanniomyces simplex]